MDFLEIIKAIILGVVEGVTEWLPISSTGHIILVKEFLYPNMTKDFSDFFDVFQVVIQLGAIMAVVVLFWKKIFPFSIKKGEKFIKQDIFIMWLKIVVACVPAAVIGVLWDKEIDKLFYHHYPIAIALITFGILFIVIENKNAHHRPKITSIAEITYKTAILIGVFQLIAAVFPGVSRSGATIIGAMLIGVSRSVATEYTFFLAIPVMFGASLLKLYKYGSTFSQLELVVLVTGTLTAFIVSIGIIKFLTGYIKKHNFKIFGWYRIALGIIVIGYFLIQGIM